MDTTRVLSQSSTEIIRGLLTQAVIALPSMAAGPLVLISGLLSIDQATSLHIFSRDIVWIRSVRILIQFPLAKVQYLDGFSCDNNGLLV